MFDFTYLIYSCSRCGKLTSDRRMIYLEVNEDYHMQCSCGHLMDLVDKTKFDNGLPTNLKLYTETGCDYFAPFSREQAIEYTRIVVQHPGGNRVEYEVPEDYGTAEAFYVNSATMDSDSWGTTTWEMEYDTS